MNWRPFLEITQELWAIDKKISGNDYDYIQLLTIIEHRHTTSAVHTPLIKLTLACIKLSRLQLMEISSLHKFIFYAEVDSYAGIKKFLKRVHTPRKINHGAVKNIVRLAKREFLIAYASRHKVVPTVMGNHAKYLLIQELFARAKQHTSDSYALEWWDDVTIWNCMDNISTNDVLELAKDKGALKSMIRHGPGDSRKELLQVIEREDNTIVNFFSSKVIEPLPVKITAEHTRQHPEFRSNPCRLIEKEREQKVEARLFANAELSNKHSLSVIALKAKKVLSYFNEQLMTPTDKKRKELIHMMSQELLQPDQYSMLLDIEGHNQSMQHANTSDLCEFIGNVFGREGWGELPNYFSMLHVYHYNKYTDEVITSEGQLGGIEGWLNPIWTMHTTLMMKLMRIMEDLDLISLAVYSDDVNGIFHIQQPTEATVQALFEKITRHCFKFGIIVKISQTALSRHRVTILRVGIQVSKKNSPSIHRIRP